MLEPSFVILEAMYRASRGRVDQAVQVLPAPPDPREVVDDPAREVQELTRLGLIELEGAERARLSPRGLRALLVRLAAEEHNARRDPGESQDILIEEPIEDSEDSDELDLDSIMDIVADAQTRADSGVHPPSVPAANEAHGRAISRIDNVHQELEHMMKELALTAELDGRRWDQALELKARIDQLLSTLERLLKPRSQ